MTKKLAFKSTPRGVEYLGLVTDLLEIDEIARNCSYQEDKNHYIDDHSGEVLFSDEELSEDYQSCSPGPSATFYCMTFAEARDLGGYHNDHNRRFMIVFLGDADNWGADERYLFESCRPEMRHIMPWLCTASAGVWASDMLDYINAAEDASVPTDALSLDFGDLCEVLNNLHAYPCALDLVEVARQFGWKMLGDTDQVMEDEDRNRLIINNAGDYEVVSLADRIEDILEDDDDLTVFVYNVYASAIGADLVEIMCDLDEVLKTWTPTEIIDNLRSTDRGEFNTADSYFWVDSLGHLRSFTYVRDCFEIEIREVAVWAADNVYRFSDLENQLDK